MDIIDRAFLVAEEAHHNQTYDIYPYIYHIKMVYDTAKTLGYDQSILVACILHDILEDTGISYNDINKAFGLEIAEIVFCVTDELGRNRKERKEKTYPKIRSNWKAVAVKICDRISNVAHSNEYNSKMKECYSKENEDFLKNIFNPDHPQSELNKAYELLKNVSNNE
jgi:(p)ppGpp synthase/HD superfamily hydrolase